MDAGGEGFPQHIMASPPTYGDWKNSYRLNPIMIYWQPVEEHHSRRHYRHHVAHSNDVLNDQVDGANRPPSYVSNDGVEYVVSLPRHHFGPRMRDPREALIHSSERNQIKA
ncbi:hypothetical protein VTO42DRAFT_3695 [Malbranchea cinnamomea]